MKPTLEPHEALADDRRYRRLGLLVVACVFGGLGGWAAIAPLDSAAVGRGVVAVESYRKTVQHLEGGIVSALHVRDGETVERGQLLVTLDDTQARAQLELLRGQQFLALAREARLLAQRDGAQRVEYPPALLQEARLDSRAQEAMQVQNQAFQARRLTQKGEEDIYEQQVTQLQAKARGLQAQQHSQQLLAASYRSEKEDFESLLREGFAERQKVREFERSLAHSEGQVGQLQAEVAAVQTQVAETRMKLLQLRKEFQREVARELAEVQAELFGVQERMRAIRATVERTVVRAPDSGTVIGMGVHTLGAVIPQGGRLLDIVPQKEKLIVEARIAPLDIDRVQPGQKAELRFSAFKMRDTPRIDGRLLSVSADSLVDERDKQPYYLARVEVSPEGLEQLRAQRLELVPGMPCEVLINTGSRTALQYLIAPVRNVMARSFTED
ncbi:HlyD family type I secretion periplasmic adaptor subunit [Caldimonas tepidiphila]|uniref:HlyD family type I secretion periplasmic adaptor subunit n=1 Tax=Caldimonas tepidiphila TaxID=2315841 RepID=UPI000E5B3DAA|nr:HlyD family type I secretion periplasmic adaptor subunit [Caldimonas tepidiphila]